MKKYKLVLLKLGILFTIFIAIFLCVKGIVRKFEPTRIIEIPDTRIHYDTDDLEFLVAERYAMIINPPKNNAELKDLMLDYCKKNKKNIENLSEFKTNKKYIQYSVFFYREGKRFSRNWKPNLEPGSYVSSQMQMQADNCLGYVRYDSKGSNIININIWERAGDESKDKEYTVPLSYLNE